MPFEFAKLIFHQVETTFTRINKEMLETISNASLALAAENVLPQQLIQNLKNVKDVIVQTIRIAGHFMDATDTLKQEKECMDLIIKIMNYLSIIMM
jgi:hypothetical protein